MTIDPLWFAFALTAAGAAGLAPAVWSLRRRARADGPRGVLAAALARRFEGGDDALLVVGLDDRLIACNEAARVRIGGGALEPGTALRDLDPAWAALVRLGGDTGADACWSVAGRSYEASVETLSDERGRPVGRLVVLRDATDLHEARDLVHALATRDGLTGVANRGHFLAEAERGLAATRRQGRPLALVAVDLHGLGGVNEAFGHAVGDALLRAVAAAIVADVRETDLVGRVGGDRFALLLPDVGPEQAAGVAERVRAALAEVVVPSARGPLRPTARVGFANAEAARPEAGAGALLARARRFDGAPVAPSLAPSLAGASASGAM